MSTDKTMLWVDVETAPEAVRRAAAKSGFGARYIEYKAEVTRCLATALKAIFFGLFAFVMASFLSHALEDGNPYLILILGTFLVLAVIRICVIARTLTAVRDKIYLFDSGLVHRGRNGRIRVFPWLTTTVHREITRTVNQSRSTLWVESKFKLRTPDGQSLVVDHHMYWEIEKLGGHIENEVTRAQLPVAAAAVARGESVDFRRFRVDMHGITDPKGLVPWGEVHAVQMADGQVGVRRHGKRRATTQSITKVPNVHVLVALAQTLLLASRG